MDLNVIRKIAVQLLYTMIFLKKHSIIHCDLKLENILLRKNGKTGIKVSLYSSRLSTLALPVSKTRSSTPISRVVFIVLQKSFLE
jgi:serine/threonine protein kinase